MGTAKRRVASIDVEPRTALLAAGDVLAIAAFVGVGLARHPPPGLGSPGHAAAVLAPFLIGWFAVATAGGLYTSAALDSTLRAVGWTVLAWLPAVAIALAIRGTAAFPGSASTVFGAVAVGVGGLFLVVWRLLATRLLGCSSREE